MSFLCNEQRTLTHEYHRRLDLTAPTAYQGKRRLIKEGVVTKAKSGRKLHMVLCNDILVLIESKNLYRMVSLPGVGALKSGLALITCAPAHPSSRGIGQGHASRPPGNTDHAGVCSW